MAQIPYLLSRGLGSSPSLSSSSSTFYSFQRIAVMDYDSLEKYRNKHSSISHPMTPSPSRSKLNPQYAARLSAASSSVAAGVGSPSSYRTPRRKHPISPSSMLFVSNSGSSIKVRMNAKNSPSRRQNYINSIMASPSSVFSSPSSVAGVSTYRSYVYSDRFISSRVTSSLEDYMDCYQDENNSIHYTQVRSDPSIPPAMINNNNLNIALYDT